MSKIVQTYDGIYMQDEDGQGWTLLQNPTGFPFQHFTNEEAEKLFKTAESQLRHGLPSIEDIKDAMEKAGPSPVAQIIENLAEEAKQ